MNESLRYFSDVKKKMDIINSKQNLPHIYVSFLFVCLFILNKYSKTFYILKVLKDTCPPLTILKKKNHCHLFSKRLANKKSIKQRLKANTALKKSFTANIWGLNCKRINSHLWGKLPQVSSSDTEWKDITRQIYSTANLIRKKKKKTRKKERQIKG